MNVFTPPRAGMPWGLVIVLTAALALGSTAGARHPEPVPGQAGQPDPLAVYVQYHQPALDWAAAQQMRRPRRIETVDRREILSDRLEELIDETHEIEVRLDEMNEVAGDERQDLQARLDALRAQIERIEQRLARMKRPEPEKPREDWPRRRRVPEADARIEELNRHREELAEQARHKEMELEELHRHLEDRGRDIENELRGIHEEIDELNRRREELAERAGQREMELNELREHTERRTNEVHMELREIHEQMRRMEEELARIERERQERRRRLLDEVRGQTEALREHLRALQERAERMQRALDELGDDGEAEELRRALGETREQIRQLERQLQRQDAPMPNPRRYLPMAPPPKRDKTCTEALEQIEQTRLDLDQMQQAAGESMEALRAELEELRRTTQQTNEQLERLRCPDHPSTVGSAGWCGYWY